MVGWAFFLPKTRTNLLWWVPVLCCFSFEESTMSRNDRRLTKLNVWWRWPFFTHTHFLQLWLCVARKSRAPNFSFCNPFSGLMWPYRHKSFVNIVLIIIIFVQCFEQNALATYDTPRYVTCKSNPRTVTAEEEMGGGEEKRKKYVFNFIMCTHIPTVLWNLNHTEPTLGIK